MQTRTHSFIETCTNVGIGWVTAFTLQLIIFPLFDINIPLSTNIKISVIFTIAAIIRGYIVRRYFNKKVVQKALPVEFCDNIVIDQSEWVPMCSGGCTCK
jgi:hypothetical protein